MRFSAFCFSALLAFGGLLARGFSFGDDGGALPPIDPSSASVIPPLTAAAVEKYAYTGATDGEIADLFLVDEATIRRDFADVLRVARAQHRLALRTWQCQLAKKLNGPMLTWLGRNQLGQALNPVPGDEPEPVIE